MEPPRARPISPASLLVGLSGLLAVAPWLAGGCAPDESTPLEPTCPNAIPAEGSACPPGLVCSYADPSGCASYFVARCSADGTWIFEGTCPVDGGSGGLGGAGTGAGGAGAGATGGGGAGATGGSGGCDDPNGGPPSVLSPTAVTYPPDTSEGSYRLELDEPVTSLAGYLRWYGPGGLDGVSKIGAQVYRVRFSGLGPGQSADLVVESGLADGCGNELADPVEITLAVDPHCHLLDEDFEGDFFSAGWSATDQASDGNLWAPSDELAPPAGVANHTNGTGRCAAADDEATGPASSWNTTLDSPTLDLGAQSAVLLSYENAFSAPAGVGEGWLEASSNGASWQQLGHFTATDGPNRKIVDLKSFAGGPLALRWRYTDEAGQGGYWNLDDVCIESYTQASCPCPGGGFSETKDVLGTTNGNGTLGTAEATGVVLATTNDQLVACGRLEDSTKSGADVFAFNVATSPPGSSLAATLHYCIESSLEEATVTLWEKSTGVPVATSSTVHAEGTLEATLDDGETYYLALAANALGYAQARYTLTVEVVGGTAALLSEGFEVWPPLALTVTDDDLCLDWAQATQTVVPAGALPTEGNYLAYFNSYDCTEGSESLVSGVLDLSGVTAVVLSFDMYHDPGYQSSFDTIQVVVNPGNGWVDVGLPFERPATVAGWANETLDLSAYAGDSSVQVGLRATTQYGNNIHIDNVKISAD